MEENSDGSKEDDSDSDSDSDSDLDGEGEGASEGGKEMPELTDSVSDDGDIAECSYPGGYEE